MRFPVRMIPMHGMTGKGYGCAGGIMIIRMPRCC